MKFLNRLMLPLAVLPLLFFVVTGCEDSASIPTVSTANVTDITDATAVSGGNVTRDGGEHVTDRGIVWGTQEDPGLENNTGRAQAGEGEGSFAATMTGLIPETTYYVRAYATNTEGTAYGDNVEFTTEEGGPRVLSPGNWDNASGAATYSWTDDDGETEGFIFGTNVYRDSAYGQLFNNSQDYLIYGAFFWIGARNGTAGEVAFSLWDHSTGAPGAVLASKTIGMADIEATEDLQDAMWVEFDNPVVVSGDFIMGADISGLDPFIDGLYGLGNVSSEDGDGGNAGLALIREGSDWVPVLSYDLDADIAIFPLAEVAGKDGQTELKLIREMDLFAGDQLDFSGRIGLISKKRSKE